MSAKELQEQLNVLAAKIQEMQAEGKDVSDWLNYFTTLLTQFRQASR